MQKIDLKKPLIIVLFGFPGSGKSYFAKNLSETINAVHVSPDKLRTELFEKPRFDREENTVVSHLARYLTEEFIRAGVSVVYDGNSDRYAHRRSLQEIAKDNKAGYLLAWLQIDQETAFLRLNNRDKRIKENKYSRSFTKQQFGEYISKLENPRQNEDYLVLSGKHSYAMQKSTFVKRLFDKGLVTPESVPANVTKPGMINLVPGRLDESRRNITIR